MRLPETLAALRERDFRLLFFGQAISWLGTGMVPLALAFAVLDVTHSVSDLGFVQAARSLPLVVFLLAGGVFADRFKDGVPVILNLQGADGELSKRLIDFASGLTYALNGGMQRVADKVFLLTPRNVEVSAEERARLLERGGFFNQA